MPYCEIQAGWVKNVSISSYAKGGRKPGFYKLMVYEKFLTSENIMIRFLTFIQIELQHSLYIPVEGWGGGLPNVEYMGMCHRSESMFHFQNFRTCPKFSTFFR